MLQTSVYPQTQTPSIDQIVSVGFNAGLGHFAVTEDGERVAIDHRQYRRILLAAADDDRVSDLPEDTFEDWAEYWQHGGRWAG